VGGVARDSVRICANHGRPLSADQRAGKMVARRASRQAARNSGGCIHRTNCVAGTYVEKFGAGFTTSLL